MTDKVQLIKQEIERLKTLVNRNESYRSGFIDSLLMIDGFIDNLQEEHVSEDLENAAEIILKNIEPDAFHIVNQGCMNEREEPAWSEELVLKAIKDGANWQKEQMMAKAVDAVVKIDAGGYPYVDSTIELYDYDKDIPLAKRGDKVKILVIRES
jgi:hypothetical protein